MKLGRFIAIILLLLLVIVFSIILLKNNKKNEVIHLKQYNLGFDIYLNKEIDGTELATLINKAVNENEKNGVAKDEKEHYISNDENSIKMDIKIQLNDKTYAMEEFYKNDTSEFIKHFQEEKFKCTNIEYHKKTGKISKLVFEQL